MEGRRGVRVRCVVIPELGRDAPACNWRRGDTGTDIHDRPLLFRWKAIGVMFGLNGIVGLSADPKIAVGDSRTAIGYR